MLAASWHPIPETVRGGPFTLAHDWMPAEWCVPIGLVTVWPVESAAPVRSPGHHATIYEATDAAVVALLTADADQDQRDAYDANMRAELARPRSPDKLDVMERARRYLETMPEAAAGTRNLSHFSRALSLLRGFALTVTQASTLAPDIPPALLRRVARTSKLPLGYLLTTRQPNPTNHTQPNTARPSNP